MMILVYMNKAIHVISCYNYTVEPLVVDTEWTMSLSPIKDVNMFLVH